MAASTRNSAGTNELAAIKRDLSRDVGKVMKDRRMSRAELARHTGLSRGALARLLDAGQAFTTVRFLARIALALDVRVTLELIEKKRGRRSNRQRSSGSRHPGGQ